MKQAAFSITVQKRIGSDDMCFTEITILKCCLTVFHNCSNMDIYICKDSGCSIALAPNTFKGLMNL